MGDFNFSRTYRHKLPTVRLTDENTRLDLLDNNVTIKISPNDNLSFYFDVLPSMTHEGYGNEESIGSSRFEDKFFEDDYEEENIVVARKRKPLSIFLEIFYLSPFTNSVERATNEFSKDQLKVLID